MAQATVEQRLSKLEHELERAKAVNEINNLVGKMQWLHTNNKPREIAKLFAKKAKDVRIYWGSVGCWEGPENIKKPGMTFPETNVGHCPLHFMANSVIEVAGDGKTAKGVWVASGIVAMKDRKTGKPNASWEFNRYGIDFIKEDGKWWIYHWHVFDLFGGPFFGDFADQFKPREPMPDGGMRMPDNLKPDYPPTPLDGKYDPNGQFPYVAFPEPYETFDPKTMY